MNLQNLTITKEDINREILRRRNNLFYAMFPDKGEFSRDGYSKHTAFFKSGQSHRVRLFRAANRVGKTNAGGYETVCHLTGLYPGWWNGKRFSNPVNALVAGETGTLVRDSIQLKLMGGPSEIGTGLIPKDLIGEKRARAGIADAYDTVQIQHVSGGWSTLQFQSFDQGREKFQATERQVIWLDEEPPLSIYTEALTRTMTTGGIVMVTFTPLKGVSETVQFLDSQAKEGRVSITTATWADAPHLSENDKKEMLAAYPPHQRDARSQGIPALGSGAIYPVPESEFIVKDFDIPKHWKRVYGMDVGWNNTAAVFGAVDPDSGIVYVTNGYKAGQKEPALHADAIKRMARGLGKPGVIDPASRGRSQNDGTQLIQLYRELGLNVIPADNAVEAGLYEVWQMLSTGRLKIFASCLNIIEEYRVYRRDEKGRIVKENDHLMDALRYLIMSGLVIATQDQETKMPDPYAIRGGSETGWMR